MNQRVNLFQNSYVDASLVRNHELEFCRAFNKRISGFDARIIIEGKRPSFNEVFKMTQRHRLPGEINVIANADIFFPPETIEQIRFLDWSKFPPMTCLALSRWDCGQNPYDVSAYELYNHRDSQDVWIFKGAVDILSNADFGVGGVAGCDNKIAYLLDQAGYTVINPAKSLLCIHYHISNVRNYVGTKSQVIDRLPPPYMLMQPISLEEVYALPIINKEEFKKHFNDKE